MGRAKREGQKSPANNPAEAPAPTPAPAASTEVASDAYYCTQHGKVSADRATKNVKGRPVCPICAQIMGAKPSSPPAPTTTPSKDTAATAQIADEAGMLTKYVHSMWATDAAKAKMPGILLHMEHKGWHDLNALNWVLSKAGCPVGELEVILTNWKEYLTRAGQKVVDLEGPAGPAPTNPKPVEDFTDQDVDREYKRIELARARKLYREQVAGGDKGKGIAEVVKPMEALVQKLSDRMDQSERDREKRDLEERHRQEIREERERNERAVTELKAAQEKALADLKREMAAKAQPQGNVVTRKVPATDMVRGGPLLDADGNPVFMEISEPWTAPTSREPEKESELLKAVTKLVDSRSTPREDPRLGSVEAELKALRAETESKRLEETVNRATGPLYEFISKQNTQKQVGDEFEARLKALGVTGGQGAQSAADTAMIKGGFDTLGKAIDRTGKRLDVSTEAMREGVRVIGRVVEKLEGEVSEERRQEEAARVGEAALEGEALDLPPEVGEMPEPEPEPERRATGGTSKIKEP